MKKHQEVTECGRKVETEMERPYAVNVINVKEHNRGVSLMRFGLSLITVGFMTTFFGIDKTFKSRDLKHTLYTGKDFKDEFVEIVEKAKESHEKGGN